MLVGMVDHPETANPGDTEYEQWMVYDEMCWFKLMGTHGFSQFHVSVYTYVCLLDAENICRKWTLETTYFCKWN